MATKTKKIDGFSLDNILQIFSLEKKSQTLLVRKEDDKGLLDIDQGDLINAQFEKKDGLDAAFEILAWDDVQIELLPLRACERTITKSLINILLEVSKIKDERKSALADSQEGLLGSAIEKAEQQQYKEAHQDLVQYLKKYRTDTTGWIWYSRIQGNVDLIRKALNMAVSLKKEDPLVVEEQRKIDAALAHLTDTVARKCYFCWAPLNKNATACPFCRSHLVISRESLSHSGEANSRYLDEAKGRYERILKKYPRSLSAIYCLGLMHMNSRNFQEALGFLDKAAKIAPDRAVFSNQLKLLLEHLAKQTVNEPKADSQEVKSAVAPEEPRVQDEAKLVLVVEDSSTTRKVIAITLSRRGYRVIEAADGLEALSKISEERPDLVMLDVILPKMDGYEILSIIKKNKEFKDIPVIMLTSKDGFINKMKGKIAGSSAYLTKPFDPDKIIAEIEKHI